MNPLLARTARRASFFWLTFLLAAVPSRPLRAGNEKLLIVLESGATLEWNAKEDRPPVFRLARIEKESQAGLLGYRKGDEILAIGGEAIEKHTLAECVLLSDHAESFHLRRDNQELDLPALFRAGAVIEGGVENALKPGQPPPVLDAKTLDGEKVALEELHGRVVLINFWARWCKPCLEELPGLVDLHDRYRERGLVVVSINVDEQSGAPGKVVRSSSPSFLLLHDRGLDSLTAHRFGVRSLPTNILIDREGRIRQVTAGYSAKHFESAIKKPIELLLDGKTSVVTILERR